MPDPRIYPIDSVDDYFGTVTGVTAIIVNANNNRKDLEIVNDSDSNVYLARGNDAVVGSGILIIANGGSYSMDTQNLFLGYIAAIADGQDELNVTISEGEGP